jgi:leucyl-tRNA synthetase
VWEKSGGEGKVEESAWPVMSFDSLTLAQDLRVTIAVQVMGKLRATVEVSSEVAESEEEVMKVVMEDEKVQKWIPESGIKKTIYVKGRLVSLVV